MDSYTKIKQLKEIINQKLPSLIGSQCIILDAPYYHNIGDVLIWKGESDFLEENGIKCLYTASYETCTFPKIDKCVTILFSGGGNIGDLYHEHVDFLLKIVLNYPDNRIIVCPQTVYYENRSRLEKDFQVLSSHRDLYFCARDSTTYTTLVEFFGQHTILLPDMAFCIRWTSLEKYILGETKNKLIIKRDDCENLDSVRNHITDGDVSDWPTFEYSFHCSTFINKILKRISDAKLPFLSSFFNRFWDYYFQRSFSKMMIKEGVVFISPYRKIETTRLHGCILSILLGKDIVLLDNSYGKNRNFYNTWLYDLDSVILEGL